MSGQRMISELRRLPPQPLNYPILKVEVVAVPAHTRVGILLSVALPLIMTWLTAAYAADREDDRRFVLTVTVDTVRESQIDSAIVGTGTVAAWREMPISSEADGLAIVEICADEGDKVQKGQVLARLNQSLLLAEIDQNKAAVAEAEASLANALSDQKRAHTVTGGVISQQTIEQRETLVKTTAAKFASARAVFADEQVRHRNLRLDLPHAVAGTVPSVACPINFLHAELNVRNGPPALGEHTNEVIPAGVGTGG
jgi:multidrug efflux pump subunit AcrA (membrane-fusion protein)